MFTRFNKTLFYQNIRKYFSSTDYDVCVIGGGPAGYIAAIKAGQKGLKTVCVEKRGSLGGTCLNVGCIPSKALLNISHKVHEARHNFNDMGIDLGKVTYDFNKIMDKKSRVVTSLTKGIEALFKKNKVDYVIGHGKFKEDKTLSIEGDNRIIKAKNYIIATGSEPNNLPGGILTIDENRIISSTGALSLKEVPKRLIVVGGGVIGLELGSVYARLGSHVDVVEYADRVLPAFDKEVSDQFLRVMKKTHLNFYLSHKVTGGKQDGDNVKLITENLKV
jgi:dihydrolipoamide dehydrogenase